MAAQRFVATLVVALLALAGTAQADSAKIVNPNNGHYYQRFDTFYTWDAAKILCTNLGGHLATITSQTENDWVQTNLTNGLAHTWLGATDSAQESVWQWVTGEAWSYTHWAAGQPDNAGGTEHYLEI